MSNTVIPDSFRRIRAILGMTQTAFANLLGCTRITIAKIEGGELKLSESLAAKITQQTGVDTWWLLQDGGGEVLADVMTVELYPDKQLRQNFTRETFELVQAKMHGTPPGPQFLGLETSAELTGIMAAAQASGRDGVAAYRIIEFLKEMKAEFGCDDGAFNAQMRAGEIVHSRTRP